MLALTKKTDYALIALTHLARVGDGPTSARHIAEQYSVPLPLLMNVLKRLGRHGMVLSVRGAKGGYELARAPEQITIGQILRALDGDILPVQCVGDEGKEACVRTNECGARTVWQAVHDQLLATLDGMVLSDL